MRGRIERRERAAAALIDRVDLPPPPPSPLFCGRLNNRGNRLSRGREGGVLCFCGDQRGPGNCARDVSFFNSVFQEGGGGRRRKRRLGWVRCSEEDGRM